MISLEPHNDSMRGKNGDQERYSSSKWQNLDLSIDNYVYM